MFVSERSVVTDWGPLGDVLAREKSDRNRANVKDLVAHAEDLLVLVRDTFPTYTMHDARHAENVIHLMGKLAAPRIEQMTRLEAALLILAAYFHDAGMAYSAEAVTRIPEEAEFRSFLDRNDEAFLATQRNGGVPTRAVIENYCRSQHADRVRVHLEGVRPLLKWDDKPIIDVLELICRSHNEPAAALHWPRFKTDFLYQADLRFCSVMLRLADILDLDDTRAPKVIYDHLSLSGQASSELATSNREWSKHLAARGFEFPPNVKPNYTLQFVAEPSHPGVEHDLRAFLTVIEDELVQCRSIIDICGDRWRGLELPGAIDRSMITGNGYKYGEFRFELDRAAVLELFTGKQLYEDTYAFIRELLQNALDAIRARTHLYGYESTGVQVWCWSDSEGYLWLRVDDDGIGMDEQSLRDYFLRVGKSYYRSAEFEAEMARRRLTDEPFGVISRFGIGILSCFIAGDQIEVSSRHAQGGKAVRLSMDRRDNYFTLQEQGMPAAPMPSRHGADSAFPSGPGTRIAVRLDPNRTGADEQAIIENIGFHVFAPPVTVRANGVDVGEPTSKLAREPAVVAPRIIELDAADFRTTPTDRYANLNLGNPRDTPFLPYLGRIRLLAVPLDLNQILECPDVNGQIMAYVALPSLADDAQDLLAGWPIRDEELGEILKDSVESMQVSIGHSGANGCSVTVERAVRRQTLERAAQVMSGRESVRLWETPPPAMESWAERLQFPVDTRSLAEALEHHRDGTILRALDTAIIGSHIDVPAGHLAPTAAALGMRAQGVRFGYNGISLPAIGMNLRMESGIVDGMIQLTGALRPDLSLSRAQLLGISFPIHSAVNLAIRRAHRSAISAAGSAFPDEEVAIGRIYFIASLDHEPTAAELWEDSLLRGRKWNEEKVIETTAGLQSVDDLKSVANDVLRWNSESDPFRHRWHGSVPLFDAALANALLHFFVDLDWTPKHKTHVASGTSRTTIFEDRPDMHGTLRIRSDRDPLLHPGSFHFPPLFAVPYANETALARSGPRAFLNANHPFTRWLFDHAEELITNFPAPFERSLLPLENVDSINAALDQIAVRRPDIMPPEAAYLRTDGQGWWWSR